MPAARFTLQIFLLSLTVILLEISYTRILSFKLVYYFTYLVIALALLGIGAGGIALTLARRLRDWPTERLVARAALFTAVTAFGGLPRRGGRARQRLRNGARRSAAATQGSRGAEAAKLSLLALLLATPFFGAGLAITAILSTQPTHANRLYFADLIGAALGCAVSVPLMVAISAARLRHARRGGRRARGAAAGLGRPARAGAVALAALLARARPASRVRCRTRSATA